MTGSPTPPDVEAIRKRFREVVLGPSSSHPSTQTSRARFWWWWSIVPTLFVIAAVLLWTAVFGTSLLATSWRAFDWGFLASIFGLSMGCSAILSVRLSVASPPVSAPEVMGKRSRAKPWICWLVLVLGLSAIPFVIAKAAGWSDPLQRGLILASLLVPLLLVESALSFSTRQERRNPFLAILGPVVMTAATMAAILTAVSSISDGLRSWIAGLRDWAMGWTPRLGPFEGWARTAIEQLLSDKVAGLLGILVLIFTCVTVFSRFMLVAGWHEETKAADPGLSPFRRLLSFLWWFLSSPFRLVWRLIKGKRGAASGSDELEKPAAARVEHTWIEGVRQSFRAVLGPDADLVVRESARQDLPTVRKIPAKAAERLKSHDWLFSGFEPTESQLHALARFQSNYRDVIASIEELDSRHDPRAIVSSPDLLVLSPPGAGRTTAFVAMAAHAAIARGQRVLFVSSSVQESRLVAGKINEVLEKGFVGHLIRAMAGCTADDPWIRSLDGAVRNGTLDEAGESQGSPQILLASLEEFEQLLFGIGQSTDAMRAYLMGVGAVIVDTMDPHGGDSIANLHLPFWLDKIRLLAEVFGFPVQVVIGMPDLDLAENGEGGLGVIDYVKDRMLGQSDADDRSLVRMAPIRDAAVTVVDVVRGEATEERAIEVLVAALSEVGRDVILYKADLEESARAALERAVQKASSGRGRAVVVSSFLSLEESGLRDATVVVLRDTSKGRSIVRIASRLSTDAPVFFRLGCEGQEEDWRTGLRATLPVLAARTAEPIMVAHLRSIAPMISRNVPIRFARLERFGILRPRFYSERSSRRDRRGEQPLSEWSLRCDIPASSGNVLGEAEYVWDMAFLSCDRTVAAEPVSFAATGGRVIESVALTAIDEDRLIPVMSPRDFDPRRLVQWTDRQRQPLGPPVDLANCSQLTHMDPTSPERGRLKPRLFETIEGGMRRIVGVPWRDDSEDGFLPVLDVSFAIHSGHRFNPGIVSELPGLQILLPHDSATGFPVSFTMREFISPSGNRQNIAPDLEWRQDMKASLLCWGVPGGDSEAENERDAGAPYLGWWRTATPPITEGHLMSRAFWPLFTAAVQNALDTIVPDWSSYARVLAFHAPRGGDGVILMVLEPLSTAGTIREILLAILADVGLRQGFRRGMEAFLESAEGKPLRPMTPTYGTPLGRKPIGANDVHAAMEVIRRSYESVIAARGIPARAGKIECFQGDGTPHRVVSGGVEIGDEPSFASGDQRSFRNHHLRPVDIDAGGARGPVGEGPRFSASHGIEESTAERAAAGFGADRKILDGIRAWDEDCVAEHASRGIRCRADGVAEIDYAWLVEQSRPGLGKVVEAMEDLAKKAGLTTPRAKASLYAALVQSSQYVKSRESRVPEGYVHFGVQPPVVTLLDGKGDCDSLAVLLVALLRVSETCPAGLVLVGPTADDLAKDGENAAGHAMVAMEIEPHPTDDVLLVDDGEQGRRWVLVETTSNAPIGAIDRRYHGMIGELVGAG